MKWEYFCDTSYFDMWAVRPEEERDFNSNLLFHLVNKAEAELLVEYLNDLGENKHAV